MDSLGILFIVGILICEGLGLLPHYKTCPPTLLHLLGKCNATVALRDSFILPLTTALLRIYLFTMRPRCLDSFFRAILDLLAERRATILVGLALHIDGPELLDALVTPARVLTIWWDGSYSPAGLGIGLTITDPTITHTLFRSLLVVSPDATPTEALVLAVGDLLLSHLLLGNAQFIGDSSTIIDSLDLVGYSKDRLLPIQPH